MALRYDLTAPLARFAAENWETLPKPFRRYAFGTVWRNEKPGPGRYREFVQCDADTVGSARPEADAEIIAMAVGGLLQAAGLPRGACVLKINNRKLLNGLLTAAGRRPTRRRSWRCCAPSTSWTGWAWTGVTAAARRGPQGRIRRLHQGRRAGARRRSMRCWPSSRPARRPRPRRWTGSPTSSAARPRATRAWRSSPRIDAALTGMGVGERPGALRPVRRARPGVLHRRGVRGRAAGSDHGDEAASRCGFGSIGGGGRYDDLVARFTGERTPATGFSFGVSRLAAALRRRRRAEAEARAARGPVVVIAFDQARHGRLLRRRRRAARRGHRRRGLSRRARACGRR